MLVPVAAGCAVGGVVLAAIGFFVYRRVQRRKGGSSSGHSGSGGHDASQYFSNPLAMQGHGVTAAAEGGAHGPLNIRLGQDSTWCVCWAVCEVACHSVELLPSSWLCGF